MTVDLPSAPTSSDELVVDVSKRKPSPWGWVPAFIAFVVIIISWEVWITVAKVPIYLMPPPSAVGSKLLATWPLLLSGAVTTLSEALAGFAIGAGGAMAIATAMTYSRLAERVLYPIALLIKVTPIVAVAPLFVIWFGFGPLPKILIAALITFFPVLVNAFAGLRAVNPGSEEFLRSLAATRWQLFWQLRLPSSLPYLLAAFRVSIPLSLIGAVVGEWWGASDGLGRLIFLANSNLDMPSMFSSVLVLAVMGVLLTAIVGWVEDRVLFWHDTHRSARA